MAESQAEAVRDLLVELLELYDPSLDVSSGSPLWNQVIAPVFQRLGTDPFDTDIRSFLKDRITQEFPNLSAQEGDALVDLLVTPLEVLLEPLKREIEITKTGQSARNKDTMRLEDAKALAANFFVTHRTGSRASVIVRVYFAAPTYVNVLSTTRFYTDSGVDFYPTTPVLIRPETMLLQRSGSEYYVDIPVIAAEAGTEGNVAKGSISGVEGLSGYTRVTNLLDAEDGLATETTSELLDRTSQSLTERSLNVRRGIVARLQQDYTTIVDVEAVGYGDPEMERDIVTGGGQGSVIASGVCIIVGQFVLMFSMFENRGEGFDQQISEGDEIELNFWNFLYEETQNETFTIDTILFDSRNAITEMPSVVLFRIDSPPSVTAPVAGALPGVLPGVFAVVRTTGKIEISDIPGGILNPDTARGTIEIEDGEIHIGGHYDVWMRPSGSTGSTADLSDVRSESAFLEGLDLVVNGESSTMAHLIHRKYTLSVAVSSGAFQLGERVLVASSGAAAVIANVTATGPSARDFDLWEMNGTEFAVGDSLVGATTGATGSVTAVDSYDWEDDGAVATSMILAIVKGSEEGNYRILKLEGPFMYVDVPLTTTDSEIIFRILDEVHVDLFSPKSVLIPFGDAVGDDLRTTIGSKILRTTINLQDYGVDVGDTIEILLGDDAGAYTIQSFDSSYGGTGPVLGVQMTATNSNLSYTIYRTSTPLQRPLIRVSPGGVGLLDPSGQDSGYTIPPAQPVDGRAVGAFSGSKARSVGTNGFVLMDPGPSWAPSADYSIDVTTFDYASWAGKDFDEFYDDGSFRRCFTDSCLECEGYIAVVSVYDNGEIFLDDAANMPAAVTTFLQSMKDWFLNVISTFNFGGDEEDLINGFSPIHLESNTDTALTLLMQLEICIPYAVFDGCNNVFVAIPEFDWETEFEEVDSFGEAIGRYNNGSMQGSDPALLQAQAGDVLTVLNGQNAGSYVIDEVRQYYLTTPAAIESGAVDLDSAYKVGLAVIRDVFPVAPFYGLPEYFAAGSPTWSVPSAPSLPFTVFDSSGTEVSGWVWVEQAMTWFFQWMDSLGFDLPEEVELDPQETLKAFWQLLFSDYIVSRPTCSQYLRMYFTEPTSCTVYAPQVCARYEWAPPLHVGAATTGEAFTLPLPDLEDMTLEMTVRRLDGDVTLSGAFDADANTAATVEDLAALIQAALDPDETYILVSGPATTTGALTITQVEGGVDEWLFVEADEADDAFFWLGFHESEPGMWPVISSSGPSSGLPYETIATAPLKELGLGLTAVSSDLVHITGSAFVGTVDFIIGETIEGAASGATGTLFAVEHDTTGGLAPHYWLTNVTGSFGVEAIDGQTSGYTAASAAVDASPTLTNTALGAGGGPGTDRTFDEVATYFEGQVDAHFVDVFRAGVTGYDDERISGGFSVSMSWVDNGDGSGHFELTIEDTTYTSAFSGFTVSSSVSAVHNSPDFVADYMAHVSGTPLVSSGTTLSGDDYTPSTTSPTVDIDYESANLFDVDFDLDYWDALSFKSAVLDLIDVSNFEGAAQALNATSAYYADTSSGDRAVLWVGTGTDLYLRGLSGGADTDMTTVDLALLGFVDATTAGTAPATNAVVQGSTTPDTTQEDYLRNHEPTLFVAAAGAAELLYTPSLEADAFQVFPGQDADGDIEAVDLPRDIVVGSEYTSQLSAELAFTDTSYAAPLELGITEASDWLYLYEQLTMLEHTVAETDAMVSRDRVPAGFTSFGSNVVTIPEFDTDEFNFYDPSVTTDLIPANRVEVGDLLFLEEGEDEDGYVVVDRTTHTVTLDRALTESTGTVYSYGNDGVIDPDAAAAYFRSTDVIFSEDDIGRYLTVWACNRDDYDGSYAITAVDTGTNTVTLDTDPWTETETGIHFAVVKAPTEDVGSSGTSGRTALVGLRPFRLYRGTPTQWRVAYVSPGLSRVDARVHVALGDSEDAPKRGVKQPYKFLRPGHQHISSTAMAEQREGGFYYFDVLAHSLGGDEIYNIPEEVRAEPVFGTYDSDGYRMEVEDNRLTFSTREQCSMVLTPTFLPNGYDDRPENLVKLENRSFQLSYEYAPIVAQIQRMMTSETDRVLCANVLARHFLPSYVSLTLSYSGGNEPSKVAGDIVDYINGLAAVDELDVSKIEKFLHSNAVTRYPHPVWIWAVTHDLDRRMVGMRSMDRITDDDIPFNGTNRTTFFISGADHSQKEGEEDIPDGERVYLTRGVTASTIR